MGMIAPTWPALACALFLAAQKRALSTLHIAAQRLMLAHECGSRRSFGMAFSSIPQATKVICP